MSTTSVAFAYEGQSVTFESVNSEDHLLRAMRDSGTFYERDVLERIRETVTRTGRKGDALDVGAFIGTHSLFFARYCGIRRVVSFEANPATFPVLETNIRANGLIGKVMAVNKALGARAGFASIVDGTIGNSGSSRVEFGAGKGATPVSTIDLEAARVGVSEISLVKIDVEGAEIDVLAGGADVIRKQRPILCVEVHTSKHLRQVLEMLGDSSYWIVDCLGWSPTYVIEPTSAGWLRRRVVNSIWICRAMLPASWSLSKWYLRRLGQMLSVGWWNLPRAAS